MKKEDFVSMEEIAALIERVKARSLEEGDGPIIAKVIRKTLLIEKMASEGKITSGRQLRRLMAIPRPKRPEEKPSDE